MVGRGLRAEVWGAGGGGREVMPGGRLREFMEERSVGPRLKVGGYAGLEVEGGSLKAEGVYGGEV